jgi:CHAT domain-containing protein
MTNDRRGDRIDSETLAAYIDGRLTPTERASVESRLATDEDAYELLVEVMRARGAVDDSVPAPAGSRRPALAWIAGGLAAAAAVTLAVRLAPTVFPSRADSRMAALVAAVDGERYVEPRLTGGFPGGPVRSVSRGSGGTTRGQGTLSSQNLALLAAVGAAEKQSLAEPTATNLHAWGVGLVLLGSLDQAIDTLESAVADHSDNAVIVSDLAAAYAARAAAAQSARDWSNALDRSERALRLNSSLLEPAFNRALAAEALHLDGARAAWQAYLDREVSSDWAREAGARLSRLSAAPQGSRRNESNAAIRAALDHGGDAAALERAARLDPQRAREWLEEDLAREWAGSVMARDSAREQRAREQGRRLVAAYAAVAKDPLPGDALAQLWSRTADRAAVAAAVDQFAGAAQFVRDDRLPESTALLAKALPVLQSIDSPLALWARYFVVLDWSQQGRLTECLAELDRLQPAANRHGYTVLAGTIHNRRGQILGRQGNQEGAIRERQAAIPEFERAADIDQLAVMHSMLAEAYRFLGDTQTAWTHHELSLKRLADTPNYRSRHLVLVQAGLTATHEGQYNAANAFQRQVVENGREWQRASGTATGYLQQARNSFRLGRLDDADASIREARALAGDIPDAAFRDRIELELLEVEGEVFGNREPSAGLPVLTSAVERFEKQGFALRLANLLLWRGRLQARAGDTAAAEADWARAVESLERERAMVSAESLRLAQAGSLRAIDTEISFSRLRAGKSAAEALEPIDRGRARTLVEDALGAVSPRSGVDGLRQHLDDQTAVVHYAIGENEAAVWVTRRDAITVTPLPVKGRALTILIDRHRRLLDRNGSKDSILSSARDLYAALVTPIAPAIDRMSSLVIVPDPALAGVSFSALNDPSSGAYLIESKSVAMAPSGALLAEGEAHAGSRGVLLVGADRPDGMPALPWVGYEIERLSAVHDGATVLAGADATRERLLAEAPHASVIHFAGHAFGNPANPLMSRLVLHRGLDDRSELYAYELSTLDVTAATVVLAACQTGYAGAGTRDDDGVLAMARPFLARGARAVVATYREVLDSAAPELMEQFHRHLKSGMTPARAWQATATSAIRSGTNSAWMAYAVFLGRGSLGDARQKIDQTSGGR